MGNGEMICPEVGLPCDADTCAVSQRLLSDPSGRYSRELRVAYGEKVGSVAGSAACALLVEARLRQLIEGDPDQEVREEAQAAHRIFTAGRLTNQT